jgi:hypothetical protein
VRYCLLGRNPDCANSSRAQHMLDASLGPQERNVVLSWVQLLLLLLLL